VAIRGNGKRPSLRRATAVTRRLPLPPVAVSSQSSGISGPQWFQGAEKRQGTEKRFFFRPDLEFTCVPGLRGELPPGTHFNRIRIELTAGILRAPVSGRFLSHGLHTPGHILDHHPFNHGSRIISASSPIGPPP